MQPYFTFEKELWAATDGASLRMNRFERFREEPVLPCGPADSPDEHRVEFTNVMRHQGRFAMWYTGMRPPPKDPWQASNVVSNCIAYSDDGITWEKPDLKLADVPTGGAPNNVLPSLSSKVYNVGVMHDGQQFLASLFFPRGLKVEEGQTTFAILRSKDGLHWTGARKAAIDVQHFEGASSMFRFKGKYWVIGQGVSPYYYMPDGRPCARILIAYGSKDLRTWTHAKAPAYHYPIPNYFPEAGVQIHASASPIDRGRIALGFMGQFWPAGFTETVGSTIGLIYSYNGAQWTEPFIGEPFLMPDQGKWDCGMLLQGSGLYSRGNFSYYWYTGLNGGNLWWPKSSAGCVRIRRDGYAHFQPTLETATLQTVDIPLPRGKSAVYLNAAASSSSPIEVEIFDSSTRKKVASSSIVKSGVMVPLWPAVGESENAKQNPKLPGKVYLRFRLHRRAKLYAFYTGPQVNTEEHLAEWRAD